MLRDKLYAGVLTTVLGATAALGLNSCCEMPPVNYEGTNKLMSRQKLAEECSRLERKKYEALKLINDARERVPDINNYSLAKLDEFQEWLKKPENRTPFKQPHSEYEEGYVILYENDGFRFEKIRNDYVEEKLPVVEDFIKGEHYALDELIADIENANSDLEKAYGCKFGMHGHLLETFKLLRDENAFAKTEIRNEAAELYMRIVLDSKFRSSELYPYMFRDNFIGLAHTHDAGEDPSKPDENTSKIEGPQFVLTYRQGMLDRVHCVVNGDNRTIWSKDWLASKDEQEK